MKGIFIINMMYPNKEKINRKEWTLFSGIFKFRIYNKNMINRYE